MTVSVIVRTKNEERWIGSCLEGIRRQTLKDVEIVLVDNESTDKTVAKALPYGVKLVEIDRFRPGASINRGIEESTGDILVCLSGHCIPVNEFWLENLVKPLEDPSIAGVYGRQEPLAFTSDLDKRDLLITFGLDPRVQRKDSFFHNANSAFRRSCWQEFPFDEQVTNIEDRLWANNVQKAGYKIYYEPEASVYHHHGIHHNGDPKRCGNIVKILESFGQEEIRTSRNRLDAARLNIVCVIPVRDEGLELLAGRPLYEYAIEHARQSRKIRSTVVSTDRKAVEGNARRLGVDTVIRRPESESRFDFILEMLMQATLESLESKGDIPDAVVMLEPTFPFRNPELIDQLVCQFVDGGFDTVIPARTEYNSCWLEEDGIYQRVDEGHIARQFKKPFYTGLKGLCCVCSPSTLREGELFGDNVGLVTVDDAIAMLEVRTSSDMQLAETIVGSTLSPAAAQ